MHRGVRPAGWLGVLLALAALVPATAGAQTRPDPPDSATRTRIVFLGTGNPYPSPERMGPSVAIVVDGTPYIVDAGAGVVRRANAAASNGVAGLTVTRLRVAFLTHLHSDHTLGLPDLMLTPWTMGRTEPLQVYGPAGTAAMVAHIAEAYREDIDLRVSGLERGNPTGHRATAHEIGPGVIYRDSNVTVTAFPVAHGSWKEAFGYRFDTPDRTIVISGDTSPSDAVATQCSGCDVLIHEVIADRAYERSGPARRAYMDSFHTTARQLADLAARARPKLLILYHQNFGGPGGGHEPLLAEIAGRYDGVVKSARDLDVY